LSDTWKYPGIRQPEEGLEVENKLKM
jgi:hypothetical protein